LEQLFFFTIPGALIAVHKRSLLARDGRPRLIAAHLSAKALVAVTIADKRARNTSFSPVPVSLTSSTNSPLTKRLSAVAWPAVQSGKIERLAARRIR